MNKKVLILVAIVIVIIVIVANRRGNPWTREDGKIVDDFRIVFEENSSGAKKIISRDYNVQDSYNIYLYNGKATIEITNDKGKTKTYSLEKALGRKITAEDILEKAENDYKAGLNEKKDFADNDNNGSIMYQYEDYSILKFHTINEVNDLYIGSKDLDYSVGK